MLIEEYNDLIPENKPEPAKKIKNTHLFDTIYDLDEANRQARHYKEVREQAEQTRKQACARMQSRYQP